jgi:hypothetical protein
MLSGEKMEKMGEGMILSKKTLDELDNLSQRNKMCIIGAQNKDMGR